MTGMPVPDEYFEGMYSAEPDPWGFETRWYETRKYALTTAMLPRERYRSAFEAGCSIGVLTALLSTRCDSLISTDIIDSALDRARDRIAATPNAGTVDFRESSLREGFPDQLFDLVVISEVGYYLTAAEQPEFWSSAVRALEPGGILIAVHWRHVVKEYPVTGDAVHTAMLSTPGIKHLSAYLDEDFRIDVIKSDPDSVVGGPG